MQYVAEYIWLDGKNNFRSKSRTVTVNLPVSDKSVSRQELEKSIKSVGLYKDWSYDGSSTYQEKTETSEIRLKPCSVFIDPFRRAPNVLVLCDTYDSISNKPLDNCSRPWAKGIFDKAPILKPWFGIEQQFYIMKSCKEHVTEKSTIPLGWGSEYKREPRPQGQYYCSVGSSNTFGRVVAEKAYHLCLEAGINASGMNAQVGIAQWEIQVGPCEGIVASDQLMVMRYILERVAEQHGVQINIDQKPLTKGSWNTSGCYINYSTILMRDGGEGEDGLYYINKAIEKLESKHLEHMDKYSNSDHSYSVTVPIDVAINKSGYLKDSRPGPNMNPYLATGMIFKTTCLIDEIDA